MESEVHKHQRKLQSLIRMASCKNGCGNRRRDGSAFCQNCSNIHKAQELNDGRLQRKIAEQSITK